MNEKKYNLMKSFTASTASELCKIVNEHVLQSKKNGVEIFIQQPLTYGTGFVCFILEKI